MTVIGKLDTYFTRRDPQLMLREKFWLHLKKKITYLCLYHKVLYLFKMSKTKE